MSHHLDSPLARQDVRLDITDLYVFRGETGTVLVINVCHSLAGDIPEPGFHPEGMYEFKLDFDHDGVEDRTYRFVFGERDASGQQSVCLHRIDGVAATDPFAAGVVVATGATDEPITTTDGLRVWAGQAGDPFWIEPDVLHAVGHAVQDGTTIDLGDWTPGQAKNLFAGHTVYSVVLEIPDSDLLAAGQATRPIGVWAVASLATDAGGWRPINRAGLPMIHPLFTQYNEDLGDDLNVGRPGEDVATYGELLTREIAGVVGAYGTAEDPAAYAAGVVARFLPNILPYVVGTPACFGFNTFNGRTLTDNAPDVMFSIAANTPVALGIGKESVTSKPRAFFPYVPEVS
ncbi:DUF4331 family protein [Kribbella shirazensis]|uniref:DUF4331 domain-containing protein n=1 Tax=Kribbella shirazensis TaxID=1105143 RepID=A0A7X5VGV5_9ACTN|nr:DUF4331 family protein [Kribbella shirazensis]NIK60957.1 hypothetical protein [Kribbella shirazensis]